MAYCGVTLLRGLSFLLKIIAYKIYNDNILQMSYLYKKMKRRYIKKKKKKEVDYKIIFFNSLFKMGSLFLKVESIL